MSVYPPGAEVSHTSIISGDFAYRYELRRQWAPDGATMTMVMLNPSTADEYQDDPTIRRCVGFARRHGHAALRVLNLFAFRSPYPAALRAAHASGIDVVGPMNLDHLSLALIDSAESAPGGGQLVFAWGGNVGDRLTADHLTRMLDDIPAVPYCLGYTAGGQPRHPLMLSADTPLVRWERP